MQAAAFDIASDLVGQAARGYMAKRAYNYGASFASKRRRLGGSGGDGSVRFSRERHLVGRKKRKNRIKMSDLLTGKGTLRLRWSATSNSLIGPGRVPIGFGSAASAGNFQILPIHFISLTNNQLGAANTYKGTHKRGLMRIVRDSNTGETGWNYFESQGKQGVNDWIANGQWVYEEDSTNSATATNSLYHKWTEIRLNLYGAKYIPLVYTISLVQMPQNYDPQKVDSWAPGVALPNGEFDEFSRWMEDISRPLIANPINVTGTKKEYKSHVKVIKQYKVRVNPLSYSNAADETTAPVHVGNVRQFKTFIRHDRFRLYNWAETSSNVLPDRNLNDLGFDQIANDNNLCDVDWGKRLYLMITCTTGPAVTSDAYSIYERRPYEYTAMPSYEGTYDIVVRNEFVTNTG